MILNYKDENKKIDKFNEGNQYTDYVDDFLENLEQN